MHRERSLNMQQAVLGAPSWRMAFQLSPAASPGVAPQILTEHEEQEQALKASTPSQAGEEGGKAESRFVPADSPLPKHLSLTLPWQQQGWIYHSTDQDRRSICQQAWPGMRGQGHTPCHGCSRTYKAGPTPWSTGFCMKEQMPHLLCS